MSTLNTPTFITEALRLNCYLTTGVLNDCYSEVTAYTALAYSFGLVYTTCLDVYATPTNDTCYSCHRTYLINHMGFVLHHIMPLVINSLGGGDTHKHTYRCPHRNNSKKPGAGRLVHAWFKKHDCSREYHVSLISLQDITPRLINNKLY